MKKNSKNILLLVAFFSPFATLAQSNMWTVTGVIGNIIWSLGWMLPLLAFIAFFYGLARFLLSAGDVKAAEEGKGIMTWGVLALFVMVSIMGIIAFMDRSLGTNVGPGLVNIVVPQLPG